MRSLIKVIMVLSMMMIFVGCDNVKFEEYTGKDLTVGVIGEVPKVREKNVKFEKIGFKDLEWDLKGRYDGILITKDNLSEGAEGKYAPIYKECEVPFFLIGNKKGHTPFTDENLSYEDVEDVGNPPYYAMGIMKEDGKLVYIRYGLYNDKENKKSVEDVYSRIFKSIGEGGK